MRDLWQGLWKRRSSSSASRHPLGRMRSILCKSERIDASKFFNLISLFKQNERFRSGQCENSYKWKGSLKRYLEGHLSKSNILLGPFQGRTPPPEKATKSWKSNRLPSFHVTQQKRLDRAQENRQKEPCVEQPDDSRGSGSTTGEQCVS